MTQYEFSITKEVLQEYTNAVLCHIIGNNTIDDNHPLRKYYLELAQINNVVSLSVSSDELDGYYKRLKEIDSIVSKYNEGEKI